MSTRIVLFSHDSAGLGHIRRNLALAHALSAGSAEPVTGLLVAGRPEATRFRAPRGWDWLILPGVQHGEGGYVSRELDLDLEASTALRGGAFRAALGVRPRPRRHRPPPVRRGRRARGRVAHAARREPRVPDRPRPSRRARRTASSGRRVERARRGAADPRALRRDLGLTATPACTICRYRRAARIASRSCRAHRLPRRRPGRRPPAPGRRAVPADDRRGGGIDAASTSLLPPPRPPCRRASRTSS